jgi:hypothetical protein
MIKTPNGVVTVTAEGKELVLNTVFIRAHRGLPLGGCFGPKDAKVP